MKLELEVVLDIWSDFHIGTGTGRGRTIDAVVLRDDQRRPYLPGTALKGLARTEAERIADLFVSNTSLKDTITDIFGDAQHQGAFIFEDAYLMATRVSPPRVNGRSRRDRQLNRAAERALFYFEDAAATRVKAQIGSRPDAFPTSECNEARWHNAVVLLIMALRRIESLGGQRRRGKGRASVAVLVQADSQDLVGTGTRIDGASAASFDQNIRRLLVPSPAESETTIRDVVEPQPAQTTVVPASGAVDRRALPRNCQVLMVVAQAVTPLTLGSYQGVDNQLLSQDYISGSTLRGAMARWVLANGWNAAEELFQQIFVSEGLHFGALYPAGGESIRQTFPIPCPRSLYSCKYHPGELRRFERSSHGVVDRLATGVSTECHQCSAGAAPLEPLDGYLSVVDRDGFELQIDRPVSRILQRTEIDNTTGRATEGRLHAAEAIRRGTSFGGYIWGEARLLEHLLRICPAGGVALRIGKTRTRGYGGLKVWLRPPNDHQHPIFPNILASQSAGHADQMDSSDEFTLTLYSDLIAVDSLLRPVTTLDAIRFWQILTNAGTTAPFELIRGFAARRLVYAFNGIPGLPRSADLAIAAGSCWRFRWTAPAGDADRNAASERLIEAQNCGVGLRRGEGFGRLLVNLPLHLQVIDQVRESAGPLEPRGQRRIVRCAACDGSSLLDLYNWQPGAVVVGEGTLADSDTPLILADKIEDALRRIPRSLRSGAERALLRISRAVELPQEIRDITAQSESHRKSRGATMRELLQLVTEGKELSNPSDVADVRVTLRAMANWLAGL